MPSPVLRDESHKALPFGFPNSICPKQEIFFQHEMEKGPLGIKVVQEVFCFILGCMFVP